MFQGFRKPQFGHPFSGGQCFGGCNVGPACGSCCSTGGCGLLHLKEKFGFHCNSCQPNCNTCQPSCNSCQTGCDTCQAGFTRDGRGVACRENSSLHGCPPNCYSRLPDRCVTKQNAKSLAEDRLDALRKETRENYACDFKEGFERAYVDIAEGGSGVTPAIPPERYWGYRYRTPDGHQRAQDWFRGYEMGASYAEVDGLKYNDIATSARRYVAGDYSSPAGYHTGPGVSPDGADWSAAGRRAPAATITRTPNRTAASVHQLTSGEVVR